MCNLVECLERPFRLLPMLPYAALLDPLHRKMSGVQREVSVEERVLWRVGWCRVGENPAVGRLVVNLWF